MQAQIQNICVLGATGSIGGSTLDLIARHPESMRAFALTAHSSVDKLFDLCVRFQPEVVVVTDDVCKNIFAEKLKSSDLQIELLTDKEALSQLVSLGEIDTVVTGIVGAAGLLATLAAVRAGKRVLIANKEPLVMTGDLIMSEAQRCQADIIPLDSEHNAMFQCLPAHYLAARLSPEAAGVSRFILTGSGGPFRTMPTEKLTNVTPAQACAHPKWDMGAKISVDSATMMNKGLEYIETSKLFNADSSHIEVVVHPQSIVHSMVEFVDGSVIAQLGSPDMRVPIANALSWPKRIASGVARLDFSQVGRLDFEAPDLQRFPCLGLAMRVAEQGGCAPAVLNAANEIAVDAFLQGRCSFLDISEAVEEALQTDFESTSTDLEAVLAADKSARETTRRFLADRKLNDTTAVVKARL